MLSSDELKLQIMTYLTLPKKVISLAFQMLFLFVSFQGLFAQAELVADINEGSEDAGVYCNFSFTYNQNCVVRLSEKLLFYAENPTHGRELYVLENGTAELLVDLNDDPSSSNPFFLTVFNDLAYFLANDNTGYKIWQTDGTTAGTQVAFDLGVDDASAADYTVFLVNNDELFFVFDGTVYIYDGLVLNEVDYEGDISVHATSVFNSFAWCTYKEGIAIMNYNGSSWDMLCIHGNTVENLFNFETDDSFKGPYAMQGFTGGINFSFEASFDPDVAGRYVYLEDSGTWTKQADFGVSRNYSYNSQICLAYNSNAFLLYDEDNPTGTEVLTGSISLSQGQNWNRITAGQYVAFLSSEGTFEDDIISLLNTVDGTIETVYTGDKVKQLYAYEDNLIFFAQSPNSVLDEALYRYSFTTQELELIFEFQDLPFNDDLYPIGIQGEYFYFYGNLDSSFGTEIYRLPVDFTSSTEHIDYSDALDFIQTGTNSFLVETSIEGNFELEIFNASGQLIKRQVAANNSTVEIPYTGIVVIAAHLGNAIETHVKVISR